jgi:hypothetical protein
MRMIGHPELDSGSSFGCEQMLNQVQHDVLLIDPELLHLNLVDDLLRSAASLSAFGGPFGSFACGYAVRRNGDPRS